MCGVGAGQLSQATVEPVSWVADSEQDHPFPLVLSSLEVWILVEPCLLRASLCFTVFFILPSPLSFAVVERTSLLFRLL